MITALVDEVQLVNLWWYFHLVDLILVNQLRSFSVFTGWDVIIEFFFSISVAGAHHLRPPGLVQVHPIWSEVQEGPLGERPGVRVWRQP